MAQLTITVDDAQVARVRLAYGVGTNAELRTAIIKTIKDTVISYEVSKAYQDGQASILAAQQACMDSGTTAKTSAEAISVT